MEQTEGFWYLASPYSKYPDGIDEAFQQACMAAGQLVKHGVKVYCPIAHTHAISIHGSVDPWAHDIWMPQDMPFMEAAKGLIVLQMPTWERSRGVMEEIGKFREAGKPIVFMPWSVQDRSFMTEIEAVVEGTYQLW